MYSFTQILLNTPKWVYVALIYLLFKGVKSLWNTTVSLGKMTIIPLLFTGFSIYSLVKRYEFSWGLLGLWSIPLTIGGLIGWYVFSRGIQIYKDSKLIGIPGSTFPLILSSIFFVVKYAIGATCSLNPEMCSRFMVWGTDLLASGLISGIFGGRALNVWKRYFIKDN